MWQHLRGWRKHSGWTLKRVACALGTTHTTILRYERGEMKLPPEILRELAQLYACKPSELQFDPKERDKGQRLHEALELLQDLEPEAEQRWLDIGRLLKSKE